MEINEIKLPAPELPVQDGKFEGRAWLTGPWSFERRIPVVDTLYSGGTCWPAYLDLFPGQDWGEVYSVLGKCPKLDALVAVYNLRGIPIGDTEDIAFRVTGLGYCSIWKTDCLSERSFGFWHNVVAPGGLASDENISAWTVGVDMGLSIEYFGPVSVVMAQLMGLAEGWCYLKVVKQQYRFEIAQALGANPRVEDWLMAVHGKTLVPRDGVLWTFSMPCYGQYHLETSYDETLTEFPRLRFDRGKMSAIGLNMDWRVGGGLPVRGKTGLRGVTVSESAEMQVERLGRERAERIAQTVSEGGCPEHGIVMMQFSKWPSDTSEIPEADEGFVYAQPSMITSGGVQLYSLGLSNRFGGPVCLVFPSGVVYSHDGLTTGSHDDLAVMVGRSCEFMVAQTGVVPKGVIGQRQHSHVEWSSDLTREYGAKEPLQVYFRRSPSWRSVLDSSSSDARAAADFSDAYIVSSKVSAGPRAIAMARWTELHDDLDTWRALNEYRCDAEVVDGEVVKVPYYLRRSCVTVRAVRPDDVELCVLGLRMNGSSAAVACNLLLGGRIKFRHKHKGRIKVSFRMQYVYDDYNYDGGGPSDDEGFPSVFSDSRF